MLHTSMAAQLNLATEWLATLLHILEVPDSNIDKETDYRERFYMIYFS